MFAWNTGVITKPTGQHVSPFPPLYPHATVEFVGHLAGQEQTFCENAALTQGHGPCSTTSTISQVPLSTSVFRVLVVVAFQVQLTNGQQISKCSFKVPTASEVCVYINKPNPFTAETSEKFSISLDCVIKLAIINKLILDY